MRTTITHHRDGRITIRQTAGRGEDIRAHNGQHTPAQPPAAPLAVCHATVTRNHTRISAHAFLNLTNCPFAIADRPYIQRGNA